jgi:phosphoribosyl-ATP pyrophosphohydrolase/phosphoribosyl-AMP cyclohydrolase
VACADGDRTRALEEAADVVYHTLVALHGVGARWADVRAALEARARG